MLNVWHEYAHGVYGSRLALASRVTSCGAGWYSTVNLLASGVFLWGMCTIFVRFNVPPLFIVPPPREREHVPCSCTQGSVPPFLDW